MSSTKDKPRTYSEDEIPAKFSYLCEAAGHHADLNVTWGKLWVKLATHSAGGITDKDFTLARKIEDTILWRPDEDGPLDGPMGKFVFSKK
jgi:4a-hydroxytetrahydrobiopterin dehydratase